MVKTPPLLPVEVLSRVLRTARVNGASVLVIAGGLALLSAAIRDEFGTMVGLLVAAAGAIELHGAGLLRQGESRGCNWLVASQFYLLFVIFAYAAWQITHPVSDIVWHLVLTPQVKDQLEAQGTSVPDAIRLLRQVHIAAYVLLAVLTFFYQGGMALFYSRRRRAIETALHDAF